MVKKKTKKKTAKKVKISSKKNKLSATLPEFLEIEKQIIQLEMEKSRISREKGMVILNKSVFLYFTFMFIGVLGFVNKYLTSKMLNFVIVMGLVALVVGTMPYILASHREQRKLSVILDDLIIRSRDYLNSNPIDKKSTKKTK